MDNKRSLIMTAMVVVAILLIGPAMVGGDANSDGVNVPTINVTVITTDETITISDGMTLTTPYVIKSGTLTIELEGSATSATLYKSVGTNRAMFYVDGGDLVIGDGITISGRSGSDAEDKTASVALIVVNSGNVTLGTANGSGVTITDAHSNYRSGAIAIEGGVTTLYNSTITNCSGAFVGAVRVETGSFVMNGGSINNCSVTGNGGAICAVGGTVEINNATLSDNTSTTENDSHGGGAIYATNGSDVTINSSTLKGNSVPNPVKGGGAGILAVNGSVVVINESTITGNIMIPCPGSDGNN